MIKTLQQITQETYGDNYRFRGLSVPQQQVIVRIQRNNIQIALLELKSKKTNHLPNKNSGEYKC